ncbi:hypothetical protein [Pseudoalteromonas umbrosa]|uniref:hypothetical protein n=1 Tax=Pseudoalteromonas umbrosa TaxID=3048489 RepID=UPI0024C23BB2|nr:hypothetical protein [Pseudoalteromonas sp. B95]MDK1286894.1 hypothetical protein [Pseudoalteromonas sp. B95]
MRKLLIASLIGTLSACGGGGGNDNTHNNSNASRQDQSQTQPANENSAPTAIISGQDIALSGESLTLTTQFSDADNDELSINWKSSLADVTFKQNSLSETVVTFPRVTEKKTIVITCEVSDGTNPTVTKELNITLHPETVGAHIQMAEVYEFKGGSDVSINVPIKTDANIETVEWHIDGFEPGYKKVKNNLSDTQGNSTLSLQLPEVSEVSEFYITVNVKTDKATHQQTARVKVSPADGPSLTVSLPQGLSVSSTAHLSIVPTIAHSDDIISYEWSWSPAPQPTEPSSNSSIYQFYAPIVEQESDFTVSLKVEMKGDISKTATTLVKVKPIPAYNALTLTSSHEIAGAGQTVIIKNDIVDSPDIKAFYWNIDNDFPKNMYAQQLDQLTIDIPDIEDLKKFHNVHYQVEYNSGVIREAEIPLVYLSKSAASSDIKLKDKHREFDIYPQTETKVNYTLTSSVPLDSVLVTSILNTESYDKLESEYNGDTLTITVLDNDLRTSGTHYFKVITKAGLAEKEFTIRAQAFTSDLRVYSGVDETFIAGRELPVFGQVIHRHNQAENYATEWSAEDRYHIFDNTQTLTTKAVLIDALQPSSGKVNLKLSSEDDNQNEIGSDLSITLAEFLRVEGEGYSCSVNQSEITHCSKKNSFDRLSFTTQPEQLKQVVTRGDYACLLGYDGKVYCAGNQENPVQMIPDLASVAKLNAVNSDTICAQFYDATWDCWGEKATETEEIINLSGQVHQILGKDDQTCIIRNGLVQCYQDGQEIFSTEGKFISSMKIKNEQICYRRKGSTLDICPLDN